MANEQNKKLVSVRDLNFKYNNDYILNDINLDIFKGKLEGLIYAEVEFPSKEEAENFSAPEWFNRELTEEPGNSNADLALRN